MLTLTQEEYDNWNIKYDNKKIFHDNINFTNVINFGNNNIFGMSCIFGNNNQYIKQFGSNNIFGKNNDFKNICGNIFGRFNTFNCYSSFGDNNIISDQNTFISCNFGNNNKFSYDNKFYNSSFQNNNSFEYGNYFSSGTSFNDDNIFKQHLLSTKIKLGHNNKLIINKHMNDNKEYILLKGNKSVIVFDNIGSRDDSTYFYLHNDGIFVICGCFKSDIEKFEEKVNVTHKNNEYFIKEYKSVIEKVKLKYNELIKLSNI